MEDGSVVYVSYPTDLRSTVEQAVASWKQFCALDERTRIQFPYNSATNMGVGYELKKAKGANLDPKEDFHFTSGSRQWLLETAWAIKNHVMLKFVQDADILLNMVRPTVIDFTKKLETKLAIPGLAQEVIDSKDIWFVRFIHYFGGTTEGEEIATPHADKSGFTLHLYESDPGLQYLDLEKHWKDMPVSAGETAIIPGMRLQYRSNNELKAIYHRVVATEKTQKEGRFSVVCFVHLKNTPEYDKQRAGRLQEFQPGFNYDMPFEEFKKLFVSSGN